MQNAEFLNELNTILERYGTGLFTTLNHEGFPVTRWMTPFFLKEWKNSLFTVSAVPSAKVEQIEARGEVSFLFQPPSREKIINLTGIARVDRNYALLAEALESLGGRMKTFWTVNNNPENLVVIETSLISGSIFYPFKSERYEVSFAGGRNE